MVDGVFRPVTSYLVFFNGHRRDRSELAREHGLAQKKFASKLAPTNEKHSVGNGNIFGLSLPEVTS